MDRLKRMATEDEDPADSLRRHVAQVQQYQAAARLLQDASVAHHRALWYVTDLKAALCSALNHHDNIRRELTEAQATTYQLRHKIERYHHNAVARARQLEEFEAELQKKLPMQKELQTLRATHQSLRDKVVELEGSVADLQATNGEWAASHATQHKLIEQMQESAQNATAFIDNRTRYFCQITWKLVQVSRDYRDLLQAHHQLQDNLRGQRYRRVRGQRSDRVITSESEGEYDDDSEVSDTNEEDAAALDAALLEEDDDNDQSEDDANTTGTTTPGHDDPYDIQGLGDVPVATTLASSSQMDISPSPK